MPTLDQESPNTQKIIVGTRPASGPEIPMSNKARRLRMLDDMPITAPMVPRGGSGMGMKYG